MMILINYWILKMNYMPIDFFTPTCSNTISDSKFGLCDDPPPSIAPAYTDIIDESKWIAIVNNPNIYEVTFIAVDACLDIRKENGELDSRCDAMLKYQDNIIFVELKDRGGRAFKWIEKAESQLRITINHFKNNYLLFNNTKKVAYIANIQHPNFRSSQKSRMEKFRDDTGVRLRIENCIDL
ncbi:MAG: hypothetical protein QM493_07165 [Sulfurovum sp.]